MPLLTATVLANGDTRFVWTERNNLGSVVQAIETWSSTAGSTVLRRTNTFTYATNNIDLVAGTNALGVLIFTNIYNGYHQVATNYNALNERTIFTYNGNQQLSSATLPSGLVITNLYYTSGSSSNRLASVMDYAVLGGGLVYYRTNLFTWSDGLIQTHTDPRGLTVTNTWDPLQRLRRVDFPDATFITNAYDKLDLVRTIDRMGHSNSFVYNPVRQMIAWSNPNNVVSLYEYCSCGSPISITNALGTPVQTVTRFTYDNQGKRLTTTGPDNYVVNFNYNALGQLTNVADPVRSVTNWFNHQGILCAVSNALQRVSAGSVDVLDRFVQSTNANNVTLSRIFDNLNRVATNTYADGGMEIFAYTANIAGVTSYLNQNGSNVVNYIYDPFDRKIAEICPDVSTNLFSYWPAGDLKTLTNGNQKLTTWNYDIYGRVSEKRDDNNTTVFSYRYYADGTLSNRWNGGRSSAYTYDAVRNLTGITYPFSPSITFGYDALNRMTSMVDAVGSSGFSYNSIGQLLAEDGPWANDTVGYMYDNHQRASVSIEAPNASAWSQSYGYDAARRLQTVHSPAGTFTYAFDVVRKLRPSMLTLPNGGFVEMDYDGMGRRWTDLLYESTGEQYLDAHAYEFDKAGQRRIHYRYELNNQVDFTYDNAGQLKTAVGSEYDFSPLRAHEQMGYAYDGAGNLAWRTNYALIQKFGVNNLNELTTVTRSGTLTVAGTTSSLATNVTVNGQTAVLFDDATFAKTNFTLADGNNTFTAIAQDAFSRKDTNVVVAYLPATNLFSYDAHGNLITNGLEVLIYDDENQLVTNYVAGSWQSEFVYDGLNRRRIQRDYTWNGSNWLKTNETRFIYDGNVILEHRDANNLPTLVLTRGMDLSGSLQGAGGIGGLLAMTEHPAVNAVHSYYHCDAGGNVTCLISTNQAIVAKAEYDPYGNFISLSGPKANVNPYWFSSKLMHRASGKYDFLYRWYAPNLQRWINQDPISEAGGLNLYGYCHGDPLNVFDPDGQAVIQSWHSTQQNLIGEGGVWNNAKAYGISVGIVALNAFSVGSFARNDELVDRNLSGQITDGQLIAGMAINAGAASVAVLSGGAVAPIAGRALVAAGSPALMYIGSGATAGLASSTLDVAIRRAGYGAADLGYDGTAAGDLAYIGVSTLSGGAIGGLTYAGVRAGPGFIYRRTDGTEMLGEYYGQAKSAGRYLARQGEHASDYPDSDFSFDRVGGGREGDSLDFMEQFFITANGGARTQNALTPLSNDIRVMSDERFADFLFKTTVSGGVGGSMSANGVNSQGLGGVPCKH